MHACKVWLWLALMIASGAAFGTHVKTKSACPEEWGTGFHSSDFENVQTVWEANQKGPLTLCKILSGWEYALRLGLKRFEDSKHAVLLDLETQCVDDSNLAARVQVGCALVLGELSRQPSLLRDFSRRSRWKTFSERSLGAKSSFSPTEAIWIQAHLERTSPWVYRPDSKAALVHFEWLLRVSPGTWNEYWKAETLHHQGNRKAALLSEATARLSTQFNSELSVSTWRKPADGNCLGWAPRLGFNAWSGFVMGAQWCRQDTRGSERDWTTDLSFGTRGVYSAAWAASDASLWQPLRFSAWVRADRVWEDYFGRGLDSLGTQDTFQTDQAQARLAVQYPLRHNAFGPSLGAGWRGMAVRSQIPAGVSLAAPVLGFTGVDVVAEWDALDSSFHPKSGWRIRWSQFLGLAPEIFSTTDVRGSFLVNSNVRWRTRLDVSGVVNFGPAPWHAWPTLGRDIFVPGVRPYRFVDKNMFASSLTEEWDVVRSFTVAPSISVALGSDAQHAVVAKAGVALSTIWFFSRDRRWSSRVDAGVFAGEWSVLAGAAWQGSGTP